MNSATSMLNTLIIKIRSDGRYEGRFTVNGKRKSFYGKTKVEVKQKARAYLQKIENGYVEPKSIILNDYVEYWLTTYKLNKIEPSSYTRLYKVYKGQIQQSIGRKKIGGITTRDVQKLIDNHANPMDKTTKPLALSGLKKIMHLLNPCFAMAVKEGIIGSNPCEFVVLPKESCIVVKEKVQFSLDDKEIETFKEAALSKYKNGEYRSRDSFILLLMLNLGLRVGEMLAVEWSDIDVEKRLIYISKTIQSSVKIFDENDEHRNTTILKNSTKTNAGVRVLAINEITMSYLEELQKYDERKGIVSDYIACTNVGTRNTARNLQRSLDRLIGRTNIAKEVSLHTLRHTFGSVLIRRGIGVEVVSKLMGHSNITVTYNKYIHAVKEQEAAAMNMIKVC